MDLNLNATGVFDRLAANYNIDPVLLLAEEVIPSVDPEPVVWYTPNPFNLDGEISVFKNATERQLIFPVTDLATGTYSIRFRLFESYWKLREKYHKTPFDHIFYLVFETAKGETLTLPYGGNAQRPIAAEFKEGLIDPYHVASGAMPGFGCNALFNVLWQSLLAFVVIGYSF